MELLDMSSMSNANLMTHASEGYSDARDVLASRVRKLRWMGNHDDARALMDKIMVRLPTSAIPLDLFRDTD